MHDYAAEWNTVYALENDPVRQHLVYPLIESWLPNLNGLNVLDLGGGNGALFHRLRNYPYRQGFLLDINREFLRFAKANLDDQRVAILEADITKELPLTSESIDVAFAIFVLNEVKSLSPVFSELCRVLKTSGRALLLVTHPFFVLYWHLRAKWAGEENTKILGNKGYYDRRRARYVFTIASTSAPYYQHTVADYLNELNAARLTVTRVEELCTDKEQFQEIETYWATRDIPKFLLLEVRPAESR